MEETLVILKPVALARELIGEVINRFERRGLVIAGIKMMQLDEAILKEHYAHLVDKPFFPLLRDSMTALPVIVMCIKGIDAIKVVRKMAGTTNARNAEPGTIRGDYSMSGQHNIVHASDSPESAKVELERFFSKNEIFEYTPANWRFLYALDEI